MKIHEYQACALLSQYGVEVARGTVVLTAEAAEKAAAALGGERYVVKAQIHSGGRGKAGGVKLAHSPAEAGTIAADMLGSRLITKQTGPEGKLVRTLLITRAVEIEKEYYLSFAVDPDAARVVMLGSGAGGTEIEETAAKTPEQIFRQDIDLTIGLRPYQARRMAKLIGISKELTQSFIESAAGLYRLFMEKDCSLVEINPLVQTRDGRLLALDAKINFDSNALFRHPDITALNDPGEEDEREHQAAQYGLSYIPLDGEIGCLVNGAGLAMATMDILAYFGGRPDNFLDVGGSATQEKITGAFRILLNDSRVRVLLINIFGGIMKCDVIARGIVAAAAENKPNVPIVARLEGTNAQLGQEILEKSGLDIISAATMEQAARTAVSLCTQKPCGRCV